MDKKFSRIYNWNYCNKMKDLLSQSSIIKQEVFKNKVMGNSLDYVKIKTYLNFVNDFLRFWEGYAEDTQYKMVKAKGQENVRTLKYQDAKDFIYSNYDYAVIIPFIDNLYKQLNDPEASNMSKNDINDYLVTTIEKAFDGLPTSIGGLVDYVSEDGSILRDQSFLTDKTEAKLYDSVKNYRKMFQSSDRIVLYKATQKAIDYIVQTNVAVNKSNVQVFINIINSTIDMITYSLVAYATRIFIICDYGYSFIDADYKGNVADMSESVEEDPKISNALHHQDINILADTDENIFRKTENVKKAFDSVRGFLEAIGASSNSNGIFLDGMHESIYNLKKNNMFTNKLDDIGNLVLTITADWRFIDEANIQFGNNIEETNQKLKSILYNSKQGNEVMSSPLQEFLHIIRGVNSDISTIPDVKETAYDLGRTFVYFNQTIISMIRRIRNIIEHDGIKSATINDDRNLNECLKLINELYSAVMVPILHRFKDLELLYNNLTRDEYDKVNKMVSIDFGNTTPNIIKSVPDTLRMPMNVMSLYDIPAFESVNMFTEYLRSLPELAGDLYLSEAGGLSGIIDKVIALITSRWNILVNWYNNKSVKQAMDWIEKHKQELEKMDLTNSLGMKIYPYPSIKGKNLDIEKGYKNLLENIKNFNPESPNFDAEKFISSLYPSDTVRKWFDDKDGNQKYYTWIISNCGENEVSSEIPQDITLNESNKNVMKECLENCININKIFSNLSSQKGALDQEVEKIKKFAVKSTSTNNTQQTSIGVVDKDNKDQNKDNTSGSTSSSNNEGKDINIDNSKDLTAVVTQVQLAIVRLWAPIPKMITKIITDQYQHLKAAYEASKASNNNEQ